MWHNKWIEVLLDFEIYVVCVSFLVYISSICLVETINIYVSWHSKWGHLDLYHLNKKKRYKVEMWFHLWEKAPKICEMFLSCDIFHFNLVNLYQFDGIKRAPKREVERENVQNSSTQSRQSSYGFSPLKDELTKKSLFINALSQPFISKASLLFTSAFTFLLTKKETNTYNKREKRKRKRNRKYEIPIFQFPQTNKHSFPKKHYDHADNLSSH